MKRNVLITGGCGFIGSHIVEELLKDRDTNITVIDNLVSGKKSNIDINNKRLKFVKLDISSYSKEFDKKFTP